jgi:hypothetical protein
LKPPFFENIEYQNWQLKTHNFWLNGKSMSNRKKKPGKYKQKKRDRVESTKKGDRKSLEKALKNKPVAFNPLMFTH